MVYIYTLHNYIHVLPCILVKCEQYMYMYMYMCVAVNLIIFFFYREEVTEIMKDKSDGSFLIRDAARIPGSYTLTLR